MMGDAIPADEPRRSVDFTVSVSTEEVPHGVVM